ncbi:MAG: TIGR02594 family protein [Burkholderiaceae bacterium]|nr:TIGR02594 family protein [Burkholderiaceae bacterium]
MNEPAWLALARADIGQKETLGPNDSPWIRRMLAALGASWLLGQPWCGGAVAEWMRKARIEQLPKYWYRAKAWLDWGIPLAQPIVGCVVVFEREGGGHVGLVAGVDQAGRLMVLGGNQRNQVCVAPFDRARAIGYRWPAGQDILMASLPVLTSTVASSTQEA